MIIGILKSIWLGCSIISTIIGLQLIIEFSNFISVLWLIVSVMNIFASYNRWKEGD